MRVGTSIFLIALGAIFKFAIHVHSRGFSLSTAGVILMIVGVIGLVLTLSFWNRRTVTREEQPGEIVEERRVYEKQPPF